MEAIRIVDKLDKIGRDGVIAELEKNGISAATAAQCARLAEISTPDASFVELVEKLGVTDPLLDEGLAELAAVVEAARAHAPGLCFAELKIARGLDYYTGTVYETQLAGFEKAAGRRAIRPPPTAEASTWMCVNGMSRWAAIAPADRCSEVAAFCP